jgi:hypothetical protein
MCDSCLVIKKNVCFAYTLCLCVLIYYFNSIDQLIFVIGMQFIFYEVLN